MSTTAPPAQFRLQSLMHPTFNLQMAYASAVILIVSIVGCELTSVRVPDAGSAAIGAVLVFAAVLPLLVYLREKGKTYLLDSAQAILWTLFLYSILHFPVAVAARLGMRTSLQDAHLAAWDQSVGVNVPGIAAWASNHWLGIMANKSYDMLFRFMQTSILLPIFTGRVKYAQKFLTANLVAFALGLPLFALLPAIGPWFGYQIAATPDQAACQAAMLLVRRPGLYVFQAAGIICFPSFHVLWAVLCAQALWGIRLLRIPVAALTGLIIFSTMTTGWHYFCDVLAGIVLAVSAMVITEWLSRGFAQLSPDTINMSQPPLPE